MSFAITATPLDPLIARDGRPFSPTQGDRMRSLPWPHASVVTGSLRSLLGKAVGGKFDPAMIQALKDVSIRGPLPLRGGELHLPRPADALLVPDGGERLRWVRANPETLRPGEGTDAPHRLRVVTPPEAASAVKPTAPPAWWSLQKMAQWLARPRDAPWTEGLKAARSKQGEKVPGFIEDIPADVRWHASIDAGTGAALEGALYSTVGLDFSGDLAIALDVEAPERFAPHLKQLDALHPMGGERRLSRWRTGAAPAAAWTCPKDLAKAMAGASDVRLVLATPALFTRGFLPGWLSEGPGGLQGTPPGTDVTLRLAAAAVDRWRPVSGWSYERRGPKAVRRLAPAGSVYFFHVERGDAADLTNRAWLRSVSDDPQDRRDGFGLATWGRWDDAPAGATPGNRGR